MSGTREWLVAGRVQGVAFRANTRREALTLGLNGLAENLPDGRVRVIGIGAADALDRLERWLANGPPFARVDSVTRVGEVDAVESEGMTGFVTR